MEIKANDRWWLYDAEETLGKCGVTLQKGLTSDEAAKRLVTYGRNELDKKDPATLWERIKE
jgi:magnesium-transporting ATPase (P-type)